MKLANVISRQIKGFWGESAASDSGIPVIKTNNLTYRGFIDYADISYRNIPINKIGVNFLQKGDLLIEKSGGTKTHSVGYVNYFDSSENKFVCNNFILGLRPDQSFVESKYLFYQLRWMYENGRFEDCCNKTTGIQNLKIGDYLQKEIIIPSRDKQNEIVKELDNVETLISNSESKLLLFDELVKSRFIEMFGESGKEESPYRLGNLCSVGSSKRVYQEELLHDGIPFLRISDLNCLIDNTSFEQESFISYQKYNQLAKEKMVPSNGDLLITSRGTLGRCYVIRPDDNFYFQDGMISWLHDFACNVRAEYIAFLFQNGFFDDQIANMQLGATVSYLSIKMLKSLMVKVPSLVMQDEFLDFLHQVDKSKLVIKKSLSELKELRDSLMQKYFFD